MCAPEKQEKLLRTSKVDAIVRDPIDSQGSLERIEDSLQGFQNLGINKVNRWKFQRLYVEIIRTLDTKFAMNWIFIHLKRR